MRQVDYTIDGHAHNYFSCHLVIMSRHHFGLSYRDNIVLDVTSDAAIDKVWPSHTGYKSARKLEHFE